MRQRTFVGAEGAIAPPSCKGFSVLRGFVGPSETASSKRERRATEAAAPTLSSVASVLLSPTAVPSPPRLRRAEHQPARTSLISAIRTYEKVAPNRELGGEAR